MPNEILTSLRGHRLRQFVKFEVDRIANTEAYDDAHLMFLEGQRLAYHHVMRYLFTDAESAEAEKTRFEMFGTPG